MKHTIAFIAFAVLASSFLATSARAGTAVSPAGKGLGIGVELGAPTSINLKLMTAPDAGVVLGLGGGIWYDASISLHADYVVHPLVAQFDNGSFSAFLGGGGWTSIGVGGPGYSGPHFGYYQPYFGAVPIALGVRVPLGLSVAFNAFPIELFIEAVPAVELFPAIGVFGQGGLGARVYF